ncbi:acyl-CoA dehydrogenase [Micavibrio aeruginosavorus]|uniref:acyl-CoA dehydrogenase n=1 Tax=Micavibrio aeruginosavorus TaxID=349221 RepID=UPI003F4ADDF8
MTDYTPPQKDMAFLLNDVIGLGGIPAAADLDAETIDAILGEAGKLARDVLAPLNHSGDQTGNVLKDGALTTPPGFRDAYKQYAEGGWNAVPFDPAFGGQGLPWTMAFPVMEMWQASNMSFGLCPLLNQGAVEAIHSHGSDALKAAYLEKLISGEWTGTMNLTEPQAGSDLSAITTRAVKQADGSYKIIGQKIFITYGEHDWADNIIHLVLARTPDAPEGVKGISLFIVPKFILDENGNPGARNDVKCVGIEHKLGIHASPTCTMQYGDAGGATGYVVGVENEGLKYMFTMMNNARLCVGLQGVAVADRATQAAIDYAKGRVQGRGLSGAGDRVSIIHHPDVVRMILSMKAQVEAGRAMAYEAARALDLAHTGDKAMQARVDFLTPIVKSWCTDMAVRVTSTGVQIHGGMGFIEETGAAQYYRDARILPIYEGTNGIQAADLAFRKILRDGGAAANAWLDDMDGVCTRLTAANQNDLSALGAALKTNVAALRSATTALVQSGTNDPDRVGAIDAPFLHAFGTVSGAAMMARRALAAHGHVQANASDATFYATQMDLARFYFAHILPEADAALAIVSHGADVVTGFDIARL